jgi:predicted aspartyl protease
MSLTFIRGRVRGPTGLEDTVEFLVDSGAIYSLLPDQVWRNLGIESLRTETFTLADGTRIDREVGECWLELPQGRGTTPVILGQPGDEALLGLVTLEILGLVLNPFTRELLPMRMALRSLSRGRRGA